MVLIKNYITKKNKKMQPRQPFSIQSYLFLHVEENCLKSNISHIVFNHLFG